MNLLALDTATEACSAAVWVDGRVHARCEIVGRDHTQRLLPVMAEVLAQAKLRYADIDGFVCGVGPGSFAGVRIAVAFTQGAAMAHARPVVGLSSLQLLAQRVLRADPAARVLAAIDARMGEVYFQAFDAGPDGLARALGKAFVAAPSAVPIPPGAGPWHAVGTGWGAHGAALEMRLACEIVERDALALPQAEDGFALALPQFERGEALEADALRPIYLRNQVALTLVEQAARRARNQAAEASAQ